MNSNYNLNLTATATYNGKEIEISFDPYNDCTSMETLKEYAENEMQDDEDFEQDIEDGIETEKITVTITDFDDIPEKWANENDCWEFAEAFAECEQDIDIVEAALECDVNPSDIDEAYNGNYKDDEDFAYEMANELGAIDKNANWPMTCIDWEQAARELMMDYNEHNGYYFRCL